METHSAPGVDVEWDAEQVRRYFAYHDLANAQLLELTARLDDGALDHEFDLGPGSIRKTLAHLHSVEPWWLKNWTEANATFEPSNLQVSISDPQASWSRVTRQRNDFIAGLTSDEAQRIVTVAFGGPPIKFRIIQSLVQICAHGTHHRAQLIHMLRHSGLTAPVLDYSAWVPNRNLD